MIQRDGDWLYREWVSSRGAKLEDEVLRKFRTGARDMDSESWFRVVGAIRDAILESWEAGWEAAGGDEDDF